MSLHRAVLDEPGHVHAALALHTPNPCLALENHACANSGPERSAAVTLSNTFKKRPERPTSWPLCFHAEELLHKAVPGLRDEPSTSGCCLLPPAGLEHGHESHFALLRNIFSIILPGGSYQTLSERVSACAISCRLELVNWPVSTP